MIDTIFTKDLRTYSFFNLGSVNSRVKHLYLTICSYKRKAQESGLQTLSFNYGFYDDDDDMPFPYLSKDSNVGLCAFHHSSLEGKCKD